MCSAAVAAKLGLPRGQPDGGCRRRRVPLVAAGQLRRPVATLRPTLLLLAPLPGPVCPGAMLLHRHGACTTTLHTRYGPYQRAPGGAAVPAGRDVRLLLCSALWGSCGAAEAEAGQPRSLQSRHPGKACAGSLWSCQVGWVLSRSAASMLSGDCLLVRLLVMLLRHHMQGAILQRAIGYRPAVMARGAAATPVAAQCA